MAGHADLCAEDRMSILAAIIGGLSALLGQELVYWMYNRKRAKEREQKEREWRERK